MSTEEGTHARYQVRRAIETLGRVQNGPQRPVEHLRAVRHAQDAIDGARNLLVDAARRDGATWTQIGDALGISRQAVRQAASRREALTAAREDAKQWRLPLPVHRPRRRWLTRPRRAA